MLQRVGQGAAGRQGTREGTGMEVVRIRPLSFTESAFACPSSSSLASSFSFACASVRWKAVTPLCKRARSRQLLSSDAARRALSSAFSPSRTEARCTSVRHLLSFSLSIASRRISTCDGTSGEQSFVPTPSPGSAAMGSADLKSSVETRPLSPRCDTHDARGRDSCVCFS
jgi:hypothetical protein